MEMAPVKLLTMELPRLSGFQLLTKILLSYILVTTYYLDDVLIASNVDQCDYMSACDDGTNYVFFTKGLSSIPAFNNMPSGTVFRADCSASYSGCDYKG
jgi:hypothetical protein